jgi:SOS response regulatory protein OraA/RecX
VRSYLARLGVSSARAAQLVRACRARGLLDDRLGATLWAEQWARRGYAQAAIRAKLAAKGFGDASIHEALASRGLTDEAARVRALIERRGGRGPRGKPARLARLLRSRGFEPELIERVLTEDLERVPIDAES